MPLQNRNKIDDGTVNTLSGSKRQELEKDASLEPSDKRRKLEDNSLNVCDIEFLDGENNDFQHLWPLEEFKLADSLGRDTSLKPTSVKPMVLVHTLQERPHVLLEVSGERAALVVENQLIILDSGLTQHYATMVLSDSVPVKIAFSPDSQFVVVCDDKGTLHFCHVDTCKRLFKHEIPEEGIAVLDVQFIERPDNGNRGAVDLLVGVYSNQNADVKLLVFSNILVDRLAVSLASSDFSTLKVVKDLMKITPFTFHSDPKDLLPTGLACAYALYDGNLLANLVLWGTGRTPLTLLKLTIEASSDSYFKVESTHAVGSMLCPSQSITSAAFVCANSLLALCSNGSLLNFELEILALRAVHAGNPNLKNCSYFKPMGSGEGQSLMLAFMDAVEHRLWLASLSERLELLQFFQLAANDPCVVSVPGSPGCDNTVACIIQRGVASQTLILKRATSMSNETRFVELLKSQKYVEAANFQRYANLDTSKATKTLLAQTLNDFNSGGARELQKSFNFDELLKTLGDVKDCKFVVDYCISLRLPTFEATVALLDFAMQCALAPEAGAEELKIVQQTLNRLTTFRLLLDDNVDLFDADSWHQFRLSNLLNDMFKLVSMELIEKAALIWKRHATSSWADNDEELWTLAYKFLNGIPLSSSTLTFANWFRTCLWPISLDLAKEELVYSWVTRRIEQTLSLSVEEDDSVRRCLEMFELLALTSNEDESVWYTPCTPKRQAKRISVFGGGECHDATKSRERLYGIQSQLQDLCYLKEEFMLSMTYGEYVKMNPALVSFALLDRAASTQQLHQCIVQEFKPYCSRHRLNYSDILVDYCMEVIDRSSTLNNSEASQNGDSGAWWECRVSSLIEHITSDDSKLSVITEASRHCAIPWSAEVEQMLQTGEQCTLSARYADFREHCRLLNLKKLLAQFGILHFNAGNLTLVKLVLSRLARLYRLPDTLDSALVLVRAYHHVQLSHALLPRLQALACASDLDAESREVRLRSVVEKGQDIPTDAKVASCLERLEVERGALEDRLDLAAVAIRYLLGLLDSFAATDGKDEVLHFTVLHSLKVLLGTMLRNGRSCLVSSDAANVEKLKHIPSKLARDVPLHLDTAVLKRDVCAIESIYSKFNVLLSLESFRGSNTASNLFERLADLRRPISPVETKGKQKLGDISANTEWELAKSGARASLELALTLEKSKVEVYRILAESSAALGDVNGAVRYCDRLFMDFSFVPGTCETLLRVLLKLQQLAADQPGLFLSKWQSGIRLDEIMATMAKRACYSTSEKAGGLARALWTTELTQWQSAVLQTTDSGLFNELLHEKKQIKPMLCRQLFKSTYVDSPPVLEASKVMPLVSRLVLLLWDTPANEPYPVDKPSEITELAEQLLCLFDGNQNGFSALRLDSCVLRFLFSTYAVSNVNTIDKRIAHSRNFVRLQKRYVETELPKAVERREKQCLRVLSAGVVDPWLSLILLVPLPPKEAVTVIARGMNSVPVSERDNSRAVTIAQIGRIVGASWGPSRYDFVAECETMERDASWLCKIVEFGVDVDYKAFLDDAHYRQSLLPSLLELSNLNLEVALEYAESYHMSADGVIFEYLRQFLAPNKRFDPLEAQNVLAGLFINVANRKEWIRVLSQELQNTEGTYAEKLICLLNTLYDSYKFLEEEEGVSSSYALMMQRGLRIAEFMAKIEDYSLNFHSLFEFVKNQSDGEPCNLPEDLKASLSEESLPELLSLADILDIPVDSFYLCVIEKLKAMLEGAPSQSLCYTRFWKWLSKVQDLDKAYGAAVQVGNAFGVSLDRIQMYQCAQTLQARYFSRVKAAITDSAALEKVEKMRKQIDAKLAQCIKETRIELVLCEKGLSGKLVEFIKLPSMMMQKLYERQDCSSFRRELLNLYGMDMSRLRSKLALEWFKTDLFPQTVHPERSLYLPSMRLPVVNLISASRVRKHEHALLALLRDEETMPDDLHLMKKLGQLAQQSQQNTPLITRIRALSLLFQLAKSPEDLLRLFLKSETLVDCLVLFLYLLDFQETGVVIQLVEFDKGDKEALVRRLWMQMEASSQSPPLQRLFLELILHILLDYSLYKVSLWQSLLPLLVEHSVFTELYTALPVLLAKTDAAFHRELGLKQLCSKLLLASVKKLKLPLSASDEPLYAHLVCAPVSLLCIDENGTLPVEELTREWFSFALNGSRLALLLAFGGISGYCTPELLLLFLEECLTSENWIWFWYWLETGEAEGVKPKSSTDFVRALAGHLQILFRESVCELILQQKRFELFYPAFQPELGSVQVDYKRLLEHLVNYAIESQNILNLLLATCQKEQWHLAHHLLTMYYKRWDSQVIEGSADYLSVYLEDAELDEVEKQRLVKEFHAYVSNDL